MSVSLGTVSEVSADIVSPTHNVALSFDQVNFEVPNGKGERFAIVRDLSFTIREGEWVCLVGASGSGKTTTLLLAGGHLAPTSGTVRSIGHHSAMVFQADTLLPHKTVMQNFEFAWRRRGKQAPTIFTPQELLRRVGLSEFARFYPIQLSAGMKARAQLGRAWLAGTPLCLLDEPLAQLDLLTRGAVEELLQQLHAEDQRSVLHVSHDLEEVLMLGSRILVMGGPPARIASVVEIPFSRPRPHGLRYTTEFQNLRADLVRALETAR